MMKLLTSVVMVVLVTQCVAKKILYLQIKSVENHPWPKLLIFDEETSNCNITTNVVDIYHRTRHTDKSDKLVKLPENEDIDVIAKKCANGHHTYLSAANFFPSFPGTLWCGPGGTEAESFDELGEERETDICCRSHDHCDSTMEPGEIKNGLHNNAPFTRVLCSCDTEFAQCLQKVGRQIAEMVGGLYFDMVQNQCYAFDHPIVRCVKVPEKVPGNCNEYELDTSKPKIWQFFQPKEYKSTS